MYVHVQWLNVTCKLYNVHESHVYSTVELIVWLHICIASVIIINTKIQLYFSKQLQYCDSEIMDISLMRALSLVPIINVRV